MAKTIDAPADQPRITLSTPTDLVAATPYLLGFHPTGSVVVLAFGDRAYLGAIRLDLPDAGSAASMARELVDVVGDRGAERVAILGYGPAGRVDPVVPALREAAERRGMSVKDALRVDEGRWWSYLCENPRCCPVDGTPFDPATTEIAAKLAFEGRPALPSRRDLERRVAPVGGLTRTSMTQATDRAEGAFLEWLGTVPKGEWEDAVLAEGTAVVHQAIKRYGEGGALDDDELAWLTVLLASIPVRDVAWRAIVAEQPHLSLWTDVVRRADPALVVAPACLLAFTAWRFGDGVLAGMALERALREDPHYSLANLLARGVQQGPPPPIFDNWGTPEWDERADRDLRERERQQVRAQRARRQQSRRKSRRSRRSGR